MVKGETKSGFKFQLNEEAMNDMEFIELLAKTEESVTALPKVIEMVLGEDQKKKLYDHIRTKDGRVPLEAVNDEISEIFDIAGEEVKNS